MMLPPFFDFVLSTARAGCGMALVLASVAVGNWVYSHPQPTWSAMWRAMPAGLRRLTAFLVGVFLVSHVILTVREYAGESQTAPPRPARQSVSTEEGLPVETVPPEPEPESVTGVE